VNAEATPSGIERAVGRSVDFGFFGVLVGVPLGVGPRSVFGISFSNDNVS